MDMKKKPTKDNGGKYVETNAIEILPPLSIRLLSVSVKPRTEAARQKRVYMLRKRWRAEKWISPCSA
jgi:hypothetical protein